MEALIDTLVPASQCVGRRPKQVNVLAGSHLTPGDLEAREVNRCIHSRILLNYHTARAVLDWLEDRVAALEEEGAPGMYDADLDIEQ